MSKPANVVLLIDDEPKIRRFLRAGWRRIRMKVARERDKFESKARRFSVGGKTRVQCCLRLKREA
jgi:hypothetical protein